MRKLLISALVLIIALSVFFGVMTVNAENSTTSEYYQITDNIKFTSEDDRNITDISLPSTYWVKYLGVSGNNYRFEYNGIKLLLSEETAKNLRKEDSDFVKDPYFIGDSNLRITIDEETATFDRPLFSSKECDASSIIKDLRITDADKLIFLNAETNSKGNKVYRIATLVEGKYVIGYMLASLTTNPNISISQWVEPEPKPPVDPEEPEEPDNPSGKPDEDTDPVFTNNNIVKIVLIVSICILAVILVFLIFKPARSKKTGRYSVDDDDDYDRDDSYNDRY